MAITKLACRGFIGILLLLCGSFPATSSIGPKAQVPETSYDFGEVFEDKELNHTFEIQNSGR